MTSLYNLQPVGHLLLMVSAVLMVPLSWVWLRSSGEQRQQRLARLTLLALFLTFDLLVFGAFTRLSDAGLGCPDWPGCYGTASPVSAHADIAQAQAMMPDGPVTHTKAWIEMIHRYLAMSVGGLILVLAVFTGVCRFKGDQQVSWRWPLATLVWVLVQGAFGALTVTMKLFPLIVSLHLMGGMVLLAMLAIQARSSGALASSHIPSNMRGAVIAVSLLVMTQVFLGAWVSTNYAVLACDTFPLCQSTLIPVLDGSGYTLWRSLGMNADGSFLSAQALVTIHFVHRVMALVVIVALSWLVLSLRRQERDALHWRWLGALMLVQALSGVSNVVLGWPMWAALIHTGCASLLWTTMWIWMARVRQP
jgi:cytochrome c oxidase assembly protein subunit 15